MQKDADSLEHNLSALAEADEEPFTPTGRVRKVKNLSRSDVIMTFYQVFQHIGGMARLADWADKNPSEFYKIYGRLLPSSNSSELDAPQEIVIHHAIQTLPHGHQTDSPRLPTPRNLFAVPSAPTTVGDTSLPSSSGEDGSDAK